MANRLLGGGFQDVDRTGTPEAFAEYLEHIGTDERVRRLNRKRAEAAGIAAGLRVLDVGCGVGFDASLLAELVAPAGKVMGVDHSAAMVGRDTGRRVRRRCLEAGAAEARMRHAIRLVHDLEYADKVLLLRELLAASVAEGALAAEEAAAWWSGLEELHKSGHFLVGLPFFVAL